MITQAQARKMAPPLPHRQAKAYDIAIRGIIREAYRRGLRDGGVQRLDAAPPPSLWDRKIQRILERIFYSIRRQNRAAWGAVIPIPFGEIATEEMLAEWIKTNTDLITKLTDETYARARASVEKAVRSGLNRKSFAKVIARDLQVGRSRSMLIARDQTLKCNAQLTEASHAAAGISQFVWVTSGDERVRDRHAALNGKVFSYAKPPKEGIPGTDFQCRCIAYPVTDYTSDLKLSNYDKKTGKFTPIKMQGVKKKNDIPALQ